MLQMRDDSACNSFEVLALVFARFIAWLRFGPASLKHCVSSHLFGEIWDECRGIRAGLMAGQVAVCLR
jgi:hypothetical protein